MNASENAGENCLWLYGTFGRGLESLIRDYLSNDLFRKVSDPCCNNARPSTIIDSVDGKQIFAVPLSSQNCLRSLIPDKIKFFERLFALCFWKRSNRDYNKRQLFDDIFGALTTEKIAYQSISRCHEIWRNLKSSSDHNFDGESAPKRPRIEAEKLRFRISCKCTGKWRRKIDIGRLSESLGTKIAAAQDWKIDLRSPQLTVSIRISESCLFIGVPLTDEPLSKRSYIEHMGLRGSVCDAMIQLADLKPGHVMLDPMCGVGTIIFESVAQIEGITTIGMDKEPGQIDLARQNFDSFRNFTGNDRLAGRIDLLTGNCCCLPFRNGFFDRIVCDLPFGKQYLSLDELKKLYPAVLAELLRVIKPTDGKMVLLTGYDSSEILREVFRTASATNEFRIESTHSLSLGETEAMLMLLSSHPASESPST